MRAIRFAVATSFGSVLLLAALTACGEAGAAAPDPTTAAPVGSVEPTRGTPAEAVKAAADAAEKAGSAEVVMVAEEPGESVTTLQGTTAWKIKPASDLSISGGSDMPSRVILLNGVVYSRTSAAQSEGMGGKRWIELDPAAFGRLSATATAAEDSARTADDWGQQLDLGANLRSLAEVAEITEVGETNLGGTKAVHYRGTCGAADLLDAEDGLSGAQRAWLLKPLKADGSSVTTVDLWIGADDRLMRLVEKTGTAKGVERTSTTYSHYGVEVNIQAPPLSATTDLAALMGQPTVPGMTVPR